ncbi:hypothetical protein [Mycobacterium sp. HM-7]
MNYAADNNDGFGAALAAFSWLWLFFWLFVWFICAIVAGAIAEERGRSGIGFAAATFFFLGPLGVGVALLATRGELDRLPPAQAKRKVAEGRRRFICLRCGAETDIRDADTSFTCWRCDESCTVTPKAGAKVAPKPAPKSAPTPAQAPTGKAGRAKVSDA